VDEPERKNTMKFRQFLNIVPRGVRIAASCVVGLGVVVGSALLYMQEKRIQQFHPHAMPVHQAEVGLGVGLLVGVLVAIWILGLGFVYGDARRRAMPAIPWTLIALFVPNLLGFLFYFVMRKPIGLPCATCGQPMTPDQRFCSWCGGQQAPSRSDCSGMNSTATV